MLHVLFVCGKNRRRSPTAEAVFSDLPGVQVMSAGTASDADAPVSGDLLAWCDVIVTMERRHAQQVRSRFGSVMKDKRVVTLDIPDWYDFMQEELIAELHSKAHRWTKN